MNEICPRFEKAIQILGKRWMGLIIHQLMEGPQRFSDLENVIHVSAKVLSERLKDLEKEGLIIRRVYPETPVRIEYELTKKGASMEPVMCEVQKWAEEWI